MATRCASSGRRSQNVVIRTDKKLDGNLFFTDNYAWEETWTAEDGRSFGLAGNGMTKDVKAKQVDGSVYEFTFHESGQPIVVTDSVRHGRLPRPRDHLVRLHHRHRHRHVQLRRAQGRRTPSPVRPRPVQGRRTDHRERLRRPPDATAARLDRLPDGLLRVPPAELSRRRHRQPAARGLQRLRRERRRVRGSARRPPLGGHPALHRRRRLADRPAARRARSPAHRGAARLRLLAL